MPAYPQRMDRAVEIYVRRKVLFILVNRKKSHES